MLSWLMSQYHLAVAVGSNIANCRFPIANWLPIVNRQLAIGNDRDHPLPRGGTDQLPIDVGAGAKLGAITLRLSQHLQKLIAYGLQF